MFTSWERPFQEEKPSLDVQWSPCLVLRPHGRNSAQLSGSAGMSQSRGQWQVQVKEADPSWTAEAPRLAREGDAALGHSSTLPPPAPSATQSHIRSRQKAKGFSYYASALSLLSRAILFFFIFGQIKKQTKNTGTTITINTRWTIILCSWFNSRAGLQTSRRQWWESLKILRFGWKICYRQEAKYSGDSRHFCVLTTELVALKRILFNYAFVTRNV